MRSNGQTIPRIQLHNYASFWLAEPLDAPAAEWLAEMAPEGARWVWPSLAIAWRFIEDFTCAAIMDCIELLDPVGLPEGVSP